MLKFIFVTLEEGKSGRKREIMDCSSYHLNSDDVEYRLRPLSSSEIRMKGTCNDEKLNNHTRISPSCYIFILFAKARRERE